MKIEKQSENWRNERSNKWKENSKKTKSAFYKEERLVDPFHFPFTQRVGQEGE